MTQDDFQSHVIEALARLDTHMESLVGNGQPGRVGKLEEKVDDLSRIRWAFGGIVTGISVTVSAIVHFLFKQ